MEDIFQVVLYIAASIALLALAWLFVSLVNAVKSAKGLLDSTNKTVESLVTEVQGIRASLQGTIENVEVITSRVPITIDQVNGQLAQVDAILGNVRILSEGVAVDVARLTADATDIVHAAKGVVISLIDLEQDIQLKVQRPIVELMSVFAALGKGIRAFRMKVAGDDDPNELDDELAEREMYDDADDDDDRADEIEAGIGSGRFRQPARQRVPAYRS